MSHDEIQAALTALLGTFGEHRARELLIAVARPAVCAQFERIAAQQLVERMRCSREPRAAIRDRLVRSGMSRTAAYRLIEVVYAEPGPSVPTQAQKWDETPR